MSKCYIPVWSVRNLRESRGSSVLRFLQNLPGKKKSLIRHTNKFFFMIRGYTTSPEVPPIVLHPLSCFSASHLDSRNSKIGQFKEVMMFRDFGVFLLSL